MPLRLRGTEQKPFAYRCLAPMAVISKGFGSRLLDSDDADVVVELLFFGEVASV